MTASIRKSSKTSNWIWLYWELRQGVYGMDSLLMKKRSH